MKGRVLDIRDFEILELVHANRAVTPAVLSALSALSGS
jgi:hypothetical protein